MTEQRIVVFAGPSLPPGLRPSHPEFEWRPPAQAGDFLTLGRPRTVVLIDGMFDALPAVRHKEILDVLAGGTPVIGAASMGALRAAEMHTLGMIGVGHIFQAFASGRLTRDDEVAVLHGPQAMDWAPLTEALVNIRATLLKAVRQRILAPAAARGVLGAASGLFYQDRTWRRVLEESDPSAAGALRVWLPGGAVNLKAADALAALRASRLPPSAPQVLPPPRTIFSAELARQTLTPRAASAAHH